MPSLEKVNGVMLESQFSNDKGINAVINADEISYDGLSISGIRLNSETEDSVLSVVARVKEIKSGPTLQLDSTVLRAKLHHNTIDLDLVVRDKKDKARYTIGSKIQQTPAGDLVISLLPESLVM